MRNYLKTLLFVSAFLPALISVALVDMWDNSNISILDYILMALGLIGVGMMWVIIHIINTKLQTVRVNVTEVEPNDVMMIGFITSYIVPIVAKAPNTSVYSILVILSVAGFVLWNMHTMPHHPLLRIFLGYRFYKIKSKGMVYTLVSRRDILDVKEVCLVRQVSTYMLMDASDES